MGGRLHEREERKLRRACCVSGELASLRGRHGQCSGRLSSELYAICSRSVAGHVQPHPRLGWVVDAWAGGCTSGRNASLGEPAAYQASLHRFGVGMDSAPAA